MATIDYKTIEELINKYGKDPICGYLNQPLKFKSDGRLEGICPLYNIRCVRELPHDVEQCSYYRKYFGESEEKRK